MNGKPKQEQFKFSLSKRDKHNREAKKVVEYFRGKGILSQAIRDGLRLINDLRRGNTRVLLELFPDILDKLCPPVSPKDDIDEMKAQLARMERMLKERPLPQGDPIPAPPPGYPQMKQSIAAGQGNIAGASKVMELPNFDDDDDDLGETMIIKKAEPKQMSILEGLMGIVDGGGLQGKNHTAEANAKALSGLRHH